MLYYNADMDLANKIYNYYLDNQHRLSQDKRFHFGSRMAAWRGTPEAYELLRDSYDYIVQPSRTLDEVVAEIVATPQSGKRNAHELRQPFFDKYPLLYGAHLGLFRVRHLEAIYGIDARSSLFKVVPESQLVDLECALLGDDDALRMLSTFAINYSYLLERVIRRDETALPLQHFFDVASKYDTTDIQHVQLLVYLYTHCIIGESNFYTREVPQASLPVYTRMLQALEDVISTHFDRINLDNKLEFLVCARICHVDVSAELSNRIYDECKQSISNEGMFIIDIHNANGQDDRNDFVKSEHRNVLYIMSTTAYTPHSTLV